MRISDIRKFRRSFIAEFGRQPQAIIIDQETLMLYKADVTRQGGPTGSVSDSALAVLGGSLLLVWENQSASRRRELAQKVRGGEVADPFQLTTRPDSAPPAPSTSTAALMPEPQTVSANVAD